MSRFSFAGWVCVACLLFLGIPFASLAQDDADTDSDTAGGGTAVARMQVRINELEEQVRRLQGALEQMSFSNRQLKTQIDKMQGDVDYRLSALEKTQSGGNAASPQNVQSPAAQGVSEATHLNDGQSSVAEAQSGNVPNFPSSHEHYSYAFKLLNQAKYEEAGNVFSAFTQRYPKDPLIGNAYYWLGETYYVRKDYVKAADNFRQGYQAMPTGPKASDNLLKLAMALSATGDDKKSCVVLKQVVSKFGKTSASVKSRAEAEMNRIDCR